MSTNGLHGLPSAELGIHSKPGLIKRVFRAVWEANQRTYLSATTNRATGRTDLAMEREIALMMLG